MEAPTQSSVNSAPAPELFDAPQEQQPAGIFPEIGEAPAPVQPHSESQISTTATLAAMATQRNTTSDETLHSTVERAKEAINNGQEDTLRKTVSDDASAKEIQSIRDRQSALAASGATVALKDSLEKEIAVSQRLTDPNALEKQGVQEIQETGAQDPKQAAILTLHNQEGILDQVRDNVSKMSIFNNAIDSLQEEVKQQGLGGDILDMLSFPFQGAKALSASEKGLGEQTPGNYLASVVNKLWSLPLPEFEKELPQVVQRIRDNSGVFSENKSLALSTLQSLRVGSYYDQLGASAWASADLAGVIPIGKALQMTKKTGGLLMALSNRSANVNTVAGDLMKDIGGLAENAGGIGKVHGGTEALEESFPSVIKTDTLTSSAVGVSGDVVKKIDNLHRATQAAMDEINANTSRMSQPQIQQAIAKHEQRMSLEFQNDHVVDIRQDEKDLAATSTRLNADLNSGRTHEQDLNSVFTQATSANVKQEAEPETVRMYHGGANEEKGQDLWFTSHLDKAKGYAEKAGGSVQYVDLPHDHPLIKPEYEDQSIKNGFTVERELPASIADNRKKILEPFREIEPEGLSPLQTKGFKAYENAKYHPALGEGEDFRTALTKYPAQKIEAFNPFEVQAYHQSVMDDLDAFQEKLLNYQPSSADERVTPRMASDAAGKIPYVRVAPPDPIMPGELFEHSVDPKTQIHQLSLYLGDRQGYGGYETAEAAHEGILSRGWDPQDVKVVENAGQHFIKVTQNVPETGVFTPHVQESELKGVGHIAEYLKNPNDIIPDYFTGALVKQTHVKAALTERVVKPLVKLMVGVSAKSRAAVKAVINLGQTAKNEGTRLGVGKWFTVNEFGSNFERVAGRAPTEKETLAYYAYKELNDVDWHIRNDALFIDKARRGLQTVSVKNDAIGLTIPRSNGRVVANPNFDEMRVFDADEGAHYKQGTNTDALNEKMTSGNYKVLELEGHYTDYGDDPIKFILAHNDTATTGPLARQQLGYVPGGHRMYNDKWFVKQAVRGTFKDGGKYFLSPLTHSNHRTFARASNFADKLENARQAYLAGDRTSPAWSRSTFGSFDKFDQLVKEGAVQPDTKFEALFDKGMPSEMINREPGASLWHDEATPSYEQELITRGRMYYSPKGEHLPTEDELLAPTVDPYKVVGKAIQNAIQTKAFSDYNTKVVEEWARLAEPYITADSVGSNRSPVNMFMNGKLKPGMLGTPEGSAMHTALENNRVLHKRLLNYKTEVMAQAEFYTRRFASYVENKGAIGDWAAGKAFDWMGSNPIQAFRGLVFDTTIGMFDPGRILLHTQTALAAQTVHPVHGLQAGMMSPVMKFLTLNKDPTVLDAVSKWGKSITGFEGQDFKDMMTEFNKSGWGNVSGDVGMLDSYPVLQQAAQLRAAGRKIFNWAEQYNRMVGWQIAWKVTKEEFPELKMGTEEFLNKVHLKTDDLTMNQTSASRSGWQVGLMSVPTQFLQYQTRMLEKMLPKALGGSSRLTAAQRTRLVTGQLLMYGAAGVPAGGFLAEYAADQYQQATGKTLDDNTWRAMSKGVWDSALYGISGGKMDTDWAARAGVGSSWDDFFRDMADGKTESVLQAMTGAEGQFAGNVTATAVKLARYFKAEQVDMLSPEDWGLVASDLMQNVASLNRAQKAYWVFKTGYVMDPNSGATVAPATTLEGFAEALGIPLRVERERGELIQNQEERKQFAQSMGKTVTMFRRNAWKALENGDVQGQAHWNKMASGWLMPFRDDPRLQNEILQASNTELHYTGSEYSDLIAQIANSTGQKPLGDNH